MKLRDTIAIEVMKSVINQLEVCDHDPQGDEDVEAEQVEYEEQIARGAYRMADAMLRVREEV